MKTAKRLKCQIIVGVSAAAMIGATLHAAFASADEYVGTCHYLDDPTKKVIFGGADDFTIYRVKCD